MKNLMLLVFLFFAITIEAQTGHLEVIHNDTKTSIIAQNLNQLSGSSGQLKNDIGHSLLWGLNGSAPLFGAQANEGFLSLSSDEDLVIRTNNLERARIGSHGISTDQSISMDGSLSVGGGIFTFIDDVNGGNPKVVSFSNSQGSLSIQTLGSPGSSLYMGRDQFVGVNNSTPYTELHVKQNSTPIHIPDDKVAPAGITIESDVPNKVTLFVDNGGDLSFAFDSIQRAYISDITGDYSNISDIRAKESIERMPPILDKIMEITPSSYFYKFSDHKKRSIGFIAQEVQKVFPEIVTEKNGYLSLSYKDFSVFAIKAIQEQQVIIQKQKIEFEKLEQRLTQLEEMLNHKK